MGKPPSAHTTGSKALGVRMIIWLYAKCSLNFLSVVQADIAAIPS